MAEACGDKPLKRDAVVGAVDHARRDPAPAPELLELDLGPPVLPPGHDLHPVEEVERGTFRVGERAAAPGQDHPAVLHQRDRLDRVVLRRVERVGEVEPAARQPVDDVLGPLALDQRDLDAGMALAEHAQRRRHELGRRGLEDADPQRLALAALRGADLDVERLERRQRAAGVVVGDLSRGRQRHSRAPARAAEERGAETLLQARDLVGDRRLGVAEALCGTAERPLIGDGDERAERRAIFNRRHRSFHGHFFIL